MKKILLSLLTGSFVLMYSITIAQLTLTANGINAVIGESFTYTSSTTATLSPGNSGANQTWNLSSMTGSPVGLTTIVSPASTTYGSSFPNANVAWSTPTTGVSYFKNSSTALQGYGMLAGTIVITYTNPEDYLRYPFAYNNTYSDTWQAQFQNGGYTFYRKGTTTVTADGYGTLITPAGTYTNVMRVHFVQVYQDSTYIVAPYVITYNNDEYIWYKEGVHFQIAAVYTLTSSQGGPFVGNSYVSSGVGVDDLSDIIISSSLFPNPATDKVTIDFSLTENKEVDIQIFNAMGQQVEANQNSFGVQGTNTIQFDVAELAEGIYFAKIVLEGNVAATKCFIVSK